MPQQPIITTIGNATSVDWTEYNLTREQAAQSLLDGNDIVAKEFGDFTSEMIDEADPHPEIIQAECYAGKSLEEIIESIRYFELFGSINDSQL